MNMVMCGCVMAIRFNTSDTLYKVTGEGEVFSKEQIGSIFKRQTDRNRNVIIKANISSSWANRLCFCGKQCRDLLSSVLQT